MSGCIVLLLWRPEQYNTKAAFLVCGAKRKRKIVYRMAALDQGLGGVLGIRSASVCVRSYQIHFGFFCLDQLICYLYLLVFVRTVFILVLFVQVLRSFAPFGSSKH